MSDILVPTDQLLVTNDRFIVDNMLTDEDLELDLDPYLWTDLSSNDSNSCDLTQINDSLMADIGISSAMITEAPETPPSSDRSTPPNFDDLSHTFHSSVKTHDFMVQNSNTLPNVTILPTINLCPISPLSPLSPILPNQTSILTIKTQNDMNLMNNNINNKTIIKTDVNSVDNCPDLRQLRREARKLRNREAATISRIRKKEYVDGLEHRINGLIKENTELKCENQRLKQKVFDFEERHNLITRKGFNYSSIEDNCKCRTLMTTNSGTNKKAALSLLAVVFMLGLNLAPFSGVLITNDKTLSSIDTNLRPNSVKHGSSRSLLWNSNDNRDDVNVIAFNTSRFRNNTIPDINCKTYINQSESLRLDTDLRDWVSRVEMEKEEVFRIKRRLKANNQQLKDRFNKPIPLPRLKAWIQKRTETDFKEFNDYAIDSYKNSLKLPEINFEDLLSAIHRRDDTFYLLSYSSKDHLIIPPVSNNSTDIRPRFSLLMPLISTLNESSIRGTNVTYNQISIMQIDCQVINTKMVLFNNWPNSKTNESPFPGNRNTTFPSNIRNKTIHSKKQKRR